MASKAYVYLDIEAAIGQGDIVTRRQIAARLGRKKTSALVGDIERAVALGVIEKCPGHDGNQNCWVYARPGVFQALELPS